MAINTVNSRIILRNDVLSNWQSSTKPLMPGEAALAKLPDSDNYLIRIGVEGGKTWGQISAMSSNIIVPATCISGTIATENMPGTVIY